MKSYHRFSLIVLLCFFAEAAKGQADFSMHLMGSVPTQEFRDVAADMFGYGFSGNLSVPIKDTPLSVGANFGYLIYGKSRETEFVFIDGFEEEADLIRNNNIILGHIILRLKPQIAFPIRPYFDAMLGGKYFYTRSRLLLDDWEEPLESNTLFRDLTWSYGGAAGIRIDLNHFLALDFRLAFLKGGRADYLKKDSFFFDEDSGELMYDVYSSRTDMFLPQMGLSVEF